MTISTPPGPPIGSPTLAATITQLLGRHTDGYVAQWDGQPRDLSLCKPLPVYTVTLAQLADGRVDGATPVGWYALVYDQQAIAIAEIEPDLRDHAGGSLRTLIKGDVAVRLGEAVSVAADIAAPRVEAYEARLLKVPEIYVLSLWLTSAADDIFIPITEADSRKDAVRADAEFLPRVAQAARTRLNAPPTRP